MEMIKTVDLHKSYGELHVLKGVNQTIEKGEVVSIIGPSGGGKSTFLRCLNLLEKPESGKIYFEGDEITGNLTKEEKQLIKEGKLPKPAKVNIDLHRQKMGMVFQHFNVFPHLTVAQNITLAPKMLKGKSEAEASQMAKDLLSRVGLLDKYDEMPGNLSGGQKQRLLIARALADNPEILILDDSSSALDYRTDAMMRAAVRAEYPDTTVILVAQRVSSVKNADQILVLEDGAAAGIGNHEALMRDCEAYRQIARIQMGGDDHAAA